MSTSHLADNLAMGKTTSKKPSKKPAKAKAKPATAKNPLYRPAFAPKAKPGKLTQKQKHFCDEWLIDHNGLRAYKAAHPNIKSDKVAGAAAARLLVNVKVVAYIEQHQAKAAARYEISQDRVLEEESYIAFSDIACLFNGSFLISPDQLPESLRRAVASVKIKEINVGKKIAYEYEYKFWDKGRALERISKHLGLYEKDNKQKGIGLEELFESLVTVDPDLAEKIRAKILERRECSKQ